MGQSILTHNGDFLSPSQWSFTLLLAILTWHFDLECPISWTNSYIFPAIYMRSFGAWTEAKLRSHWIQSEEDEASFFLREWVKFKQSSSVHAQHCRPETHRRRIHYTSLASQPKREHRSTLGHYGYRKGVSALKDVFIDKIFLPIQLAIHH